MPHSTPRRIRIEDRRVLGYFTADNAIFDQFPDLTAPAKLVYLALCRYAGNADTCYPSHAILAIACSLGASTVRRVLKELVAAGLVALEHRQEPRGQTTNVYSLLSLTPARCEQGGARSEQDPRSLRAGPLLGASDEEETPEKNTEEGEPPAVRRGLSQAELVAKLKRSGWNP